jgi:hypothetical protein
MTAEMGTGEVPAPTLWGGVLFPYAGEGPYSKCAVPGEPFGLTFPFSVAPFELMLVGEPTVALGRTGQSSFRIVPVASAAAIVAFVGDVRSMRNVSSDSGMVSPFTGTAMAVFGTPG